MALKRHRFLGKMAAFKIALHPVKNVTFFYQLYVLETLKFSHYLLGILQDGQRIVTVVKGANPKGRSKGLR